MAALSLRDSATARWGTTSDYATHRVYETQSQRVPFRLLLRTDFALFDFFSACFSRDPSPFVKEVPDSDSFKLTILFRRSSGADLLDWVRKVQEHARSGFFAGRGLNWRCILSTVETGPEILGRVVFPDIVLQSLAALTSFQTVLMDPNVELMSQGVLRNGIVPNGMFHWQDRQGVRDAKQEIVFEARLCLRSDGEVDGDWLARLREGKAVEAVETSVVCIPTSEDIKYVLPRPTHGHRLIREWASKSGVLNKKGAVATNSAMRIGDCYGFTLCLSSLEEQMELYKKLHAILSQDCHFAMTERAVGVYAYFLDLDVKIDSPVEDWEKCTAAFVRAALETVCELYDGTVPQTIVSTSDTVALSTGERVPTSRAEGLGGKRGVHLVFGNILVDKQTAMALRKAVVTRLERCSELREYPVDLEKVVDESVYKSSSGLRILGAVKTAKKAVGACHSTPINIFTQQHVRCG